MEGIDVANTRSMVCSVVHLPAQILILFGCYKTEVGIFYSLTIVHLLINLVSMLIYVSTSSVMEENKYL